MYVQYLSHIYQPKRKCKDGGSKLYKNQKYRPLEIEKKLFFDFISEIPNFSNMHVSENAQCFVGAFL